MKSFCTPYQNRREDMVIGHIDGRRRPRGRIEPSKPSAMSQAKPGTIVFNGRTARRLTA